MISTRPTRLADIQAVLEAPSDITRDELLCAGFTKWTALKFLRDCLKDGEAHAVLVDGKAVFVIGIAPHPLLPRHSSLWFITTEAYWKQGAAGVREGRAVLRGIQRDYPDQNLVARTWSDHPDVERWFALLGFERQSFEGLSQVFVRPALAKAKADRHSTI